MSPISVPLMLFGTAMSTDSGSIGALYFSSSLILVYAAVLVITSLVLNYTLKSNNKVKLLLMLFIFLGAKLFSNEVLAIPLVLSVAAGYLFYDKFDNWSTAVKKICMYGPVVLLVAYTGIIAVSVL